MSSKQNWAIVQDTNGYVFVGNSEGLLKFDGSKWQSIHVTRNRTVRSLLRTSSGQVLIGGEGEFGKIITDSVNNFTYEELSTKLPQYYQNFSEVWKIVSSNSKSYLQTQEYIFVINDESGDIDIIESDYRFRQLSKAGERLFVRLTGKGISEIFDDTLKFIDGSELFADENLYEVSSIDDKIFFASRNYGLTLFEDGKFKVINKEVSKYLSEKEIYRAREQGKKIWFATLSGGIVAINNEAEFVEKIDSKSGLSSDVIYSIYIDGEGTLWASTDGDINKILVQVPIRLIDSRNDLNGDIYTAILKDQKLFVGTSEGLFRSEKIQDRYSFAKLDQIGRVLHLDSVWGGIIVNSTTGVFFVMEDNVIKILDEYFHQLSSYDKTVYLSKGAEVFELKTYKNKPNFVTEFSGFITDFFAEENRIWGVVGSNKVDLFNLDEKTFKEVNTNLSEAESIELISSLIDTIRIGTTSGLYKFDESILEFTKDGLFSDHNFFDKQVYNFSQCKERIWFRANRKNILFEKIGSKWLHGESRFDLIASKVEEGVLNILCGNDETFFVANSNIYVLTDPDWKYKTEFKTNITDIYVNRDSLIYGGFGEPVKPIVLPYKDNELRFNYAAASYIDPERNTYSYKLEGFDNDWSEWSLETQKDYTNIPEGEYIFKVRSRNVYEVDGKPDQIAFKVLPPWYRTWWAYVLYFISFSALMYTGYKIRVNQLLKVERMRTKIASDLHDEVSATLTGISYFAEAIKRDKDESKAAHFVSLISESAGDAKEKITDIVWSITPENDSWELFLSKCRRYASDLLESKNLEYTLNITDQIPGKLTMDVRQHVWMIFKEMITNAARHSNASRLDVILDVEDRVLKLIVQDNGSGFNLDEVQEGNGIRNIRKRAAKINASIKIHSEESFGTRWRMELPL